MTEAPFQQPNLKTRLTRQSLRHAHHRAHKGLNNRIENAHRQTRKREKIMGRFKSPRQAQRFLSAHDQINTIFRPCRYKLSARSWRHARADAFCLWSDYTAEMTA
ncbi:DDE-type integrase/transposase/recombinase [Labrenzia sp. OB1]|uniref:DDE-type integrase/transposase/recombinase n=1 Tax=Labrenzia sp. OB1 TaxID=1561204 RepID=UPI002448CC23|nr:DDE-type integrase/transposase/recombinase [Labrenzia sp. OB1]